jgi:hypothetical protein
MRPGGSQLGSHLAAAAAAAAARASVIENMAAAAPECNTLCLVGKSRPIPFAGIDLLGNDPRPQANMWVTLPSVAGSENGDAAVGCKVSHSR